jgi:hypothetical protein
MFYTLLLDEGAYYLLTKVAKISILNCFKGRIYGKENCKKEYS